ncbi:hypothetical protein DACRYDRAFT_102806, partial [Dacryopinax primogenitus]
MMYAFLFIQLLLAAMSNCTVLMERGTKLDTMEPSLATNLAKVGLLSSGVYWSGTSPWCKGECKAGDYQIVASSAGNPSHYASLSNFGSACLIVASTALASPLPSSSDISLLNSGPGTIYGTTLQLECEKRGGTLPGLGWNYEGCSLKNPGPLCTSFPGSRTVLLHEIYVIPLSPNVPPDVRRCPMEMHHLISSARCPLSDGSTGTIAVLRTRIVNLLSSQAKPITSLHAHCFDIPSPPIHVTPSLGEDGCSLEEWVTVVEQLWEDGCHWVEVSVEYEERQLENAYVPVQGSAEKRGKAQEELEELVHPTGEVIVWDELLLALEGATWTTRLPKDHPIPDIPVSDSLEDTSFPVSQRYPHVCLLRASCSSSSAPLVSLDRRRFCELSEPRQLVVPVVRFLAELKQSQSKCDDGVIKVKFYAAFGRVGPDVLVEMREDASEGKPKGAVLSWDAFEYRLLNWKWHACPPEMWDDWLDKAPAFAAQIAEAKSFVDGHIWTRIENHMLKQSLSLSSIRAVCGNDELVFRLEYCSTTYPRGNLMQGVAS